MTHQTLDTKELERRIFKRRMIVSAVVVMLMLAVLVSRLSFLQVVEHEKHQALSDNNRLEVVAIPPTRGLIYDRNGELLAENLPSHTLSIVVERAGDIDQLLADIPGGCRAF